MTLVQPKVYTIDAGQSFVDALAKGLINKYGRDPLSLSSVTILLPNRRASRSLREAFLRLYGHKPLLLPTMRAVGDVDEGEIEFLGAGLGLDLSSMLPPISALRRQVLLTQLVERRPLPDAAGKGLAPAQAWRLAGELARLIDQVDTAGLSFKALKDLAPDSLAAHWNETLEFLQIVTRHWPRILKAEEAQDPAAYRNQTLREVARIFEATSHSGSPSGPVVAAGSTGSIPATAHLLRVIARLPKGCVILPALDVDMDDDIWATLGETHPQSSMKRLLDVIGVSRHQVENWSSAPSEETEAYHRSRLISNALLPASATEHWRDVGLRDYSDDALFEGLRAIVAPSRREEAGAIAVILREALETPGKTASLVTPDRQLALYVRAVLLNWGITIDDSGGDKAINSLPGRLLGLIASAVSDSFGPLSFLSLMQHPLVSAGLHREEFQSVARRLDREILRGVRPAGGLAGIAAKTRDYLKAQTKNNSAAKGENSGFLKRVERIIALLMPLETLLSQPVNVDDVLRAHIDIAEKLCVDDEISGADRLWRGDAGAALSDHLTGLIEQGGELMVPSAESYSAFFAEMMATVTVRSNWNQHPRLAIWGPLEARLQRADLMILGGLNEGVWPGEPTTDPWMSRDMRKQFGLPSHDQRIGQSAHDFMLGINAPEVVVTRSEKTDGTPTVPSRWWFRIEAVAGRNIPWADHYLHWAAQLHAPTVVEPVSPPTPKPPVAARPTQLSVTQIQEWMRDPYALYAKKILGLSRLDPLDDTPNAAQKGTLLHEALEVFMATDGAKFGEEGLKRLVAVGREVFAPVISQPAVYAFWWPRFERIAKWFVENEETRQERFDPVLIEGWARQASQFDPSVPEFTLIAKADRIDRNRETGKLEIIDYKTGETPTSKQVEAGYAPQLPLEGWLAKLGAFEGLEAAEAESLVFWKLSGGEPVHEVKAPIKNVPASIEEAAAGLRKLVAIFANPDTAYLSNPRPEVAGYGDYDHLARVKEWRNLVDPLNEELVIGKPEPSS